MAFVNGILKAPEVQQVPTASHGGPITPHFIVWHYTACSAASARAAFLSPRLKVSAHFMVLEDGQIEQFVSCDHAAWHAGKSSWDGRIGMNNFSIGIELVNPGPLQGEPPRSLYGTRHEGEVVTLAKPGGGSQMWAAYPEAQLLAADWLAEQICGAYSIEAMLRHSDVAPNRKIDPGPAFPMQRYAVLLESREGDSTTDLDEILPHTNIRTTPGGKILITTKDARMPCTFCDFAGDWARVKLSFPDKDDGSKIKDYFVYVHRSRLV
jgi:N-acetylmuramoyl-L-alanine amidase